MNNCLARAAILVAATLTLACAGQTSYEYVPALSNANHPRIGYWFWTPDLLEGDKYLDDFKAMCGQMPFDLVFLSARLGCDFHDTARFHEPLRRLVAEAARHGVGIGIQLWDKPGDIPDSLCQQVVTEAECVVPSSGQVRLVTASRHIRTANIGDVGGRRPTGSRLLRAYAFRSQGDGTIVAGTLTDITDRCQVAAVAGRIEVRAHAPELAGMTVYLLAAHSYNNPDMFAHAAQTMRRTLEAYADIPLAGTALDEFSYMRITHPDNMGGDVWRDRFYSESMASAYRSTYGRDLVEDLLLMRHAPQGADSLRAASINRYMKLLRSGPLAVEQAFYDDSKRLFGDKTFIGFHNTFHNTLVKDELWATGANWWTAARDYGHTDEHSSLPVQLGIALANPAHNALYNMFYDPSAEVVYRKAATDLRYGIRTLYHAMNDKQAWGASLDNPEVMERITRIERGAALLNRSDTPMPRVDALVIFGTGALANWYPDPSARGVYDINESLGIEEKSLELLRAGYMTALVPDELIDNGSLTLTPEGRARLGGREFEALVFLYPQYASQTTISFLERFLDAGGRLMIEGDADRDFDGCDIRGRIASIRARALCSQFSVEQMPRLGLVASAIDGGCVADDGSVVFSDWESLDSGQATSFRYEDGEDCYTGLYRGLLILRTERGKVAQLAADGLVELCCNGKPLLRFDSPASLEVHRKGRNYTITLVDEHAALRPVVNNL